VGCEATHSEFDKLVVLRIAAGCYPHIDVDPLSLVRQSSEKTSDVFLIEISAEVLSAQNFAEFSECGQGKKYLCSLQRQVDGKATLRIGQEQSADNNFCIEDAAQLCALQQRIQHLRGESSSLRFASDLIEYLL